MTHFIRTFVASIATTLCVVALGCATGTSNTKSTVGSTTTPSPAPSIIQILPQTIPVGAPSQAIRVTGTNFADRAVILWNGTAVVTAKIDASTLSGTVDRSVLVTPATVQLQVQNDSDGQKSTAVPLTVTPATTPPSTALTITSSTLAAGTIGGGYSQSLQATGGSPGYTWAVTAGILPSGLTLAPTGALSGMPVASGTSTFSVTVADSSSPAKTQSVATSIVIAPNTLSIPATTLPPATQGALYLQALQAVGGTPGYIWAITSGSLPAGIVFDANGKISGLPTVSGTFIVTASVTDNSSPAQSRSIVLSLTVAATQLAIVSVTLSSPTQGLSYAQTLQATGGTPQYTWALTSGSLPAGVALTPAGIITGTPNASGTFLFTATVTDSASPTQSQSANLSMVVTATPLAVAPLSLSSATSGVFYQQTLRATGGTPQYSWALTSGTLPAGITLTQAGSILGTPTANGSFPFTATVTDTGNPAQSRSIPMVLNVAPSTLAITYSTLDSASSGTAYAQSFQANGGTPGYTWSVSSGSLPTGLAMNTNGLVFGMPTTAGTFAFMATVSDAGSPAQTKSVTISLVVTPSSQLTILTSSFASATSGSPYSQTLHAAGGTPGYQWSVSSGSLPAGLGMTSSGIVSGIPTATGPFTFNVTVADASSPAQSKSVAISILVSPTPLSATAPSLASGTNNVTYSQTLQASGGTPAYGWIVTGGSLPTGLSLSPNGAIAGTPSASGTSNFTANVTDSGSPAQSQSVNASIVVAPPALAITTSSMAAATNGTAYSQILQGAGGTAPYAWTLTSGTLPTGISLGSNGTISGTPSSAGNFTFTFAVTDSGSPAQTRSATLSVLVNPSQLAITSSALAGATNGTAYSQTVQATGGTSGYIWTVTSGSLPAGVTLAANGIVSGTPTGTGTSNFTVTVTDSGSPSQTKSAATSIVAAASALSITSSALTDGTKGMAYSQAMQAAGGTTSYNWAVTSGTLPAGITLASNGTLSGTPAASGTSNIIVTVTDSSNPVQSKSAATSIVVAASGLSITSSTLAAGTKGTAYSQTLQAAGGTSAYTWAISAGTPPAGLTLASNGTLSGTPTTVATSNFTVTVTDSSSPAQTKSAATSLVVAASALTITSSALPSGTKATAYTKTLQATGGTATYTWTVSAGTLPAGLTLSTAGVISGTPTAPGTSNFTLLVTDSSSPIQTKSAATSIVIAGAALSITSSTLASGVAGTTYSQTLAATGGTSGYTWSVTTGSLPAGLNLAASTGALTGTPTAAGTSNFTVTVTDSSSPALTKSAATSIAVSIAALSITTGSLASGTNGTNYAQALSATGGTASYTWAITSGNLPAGLTLAATTGVISGSPTVTGSSTFTMSVTDSSSPAQTKSASGSITIANAVAAGPGTTWYIRADGGTRYSVNATQGQCDGKSDSAYGGVGTNQHCAFNDYRYLYDDRTYTDNAWVISGGDTVIIDNTKQWRIGFDQGASPNDVWCVHGTGPFGCLNPTIPAGTAGQHTRILGRNYAACSTGNQPDKSKMTQLFGGFGVYTVLNLSGAQFLDVQCLELTRHSQCIRHGYPVYPSGCHSDYPLDDYDSEGINTNVGTHDLLLQDMWVHGHTDRGVIGPIGGLVTAQRVIIAYNGMAGWDFDDGNATPFGPGSVWKFLNSTMEWSGCNQEYPITSAFPAISCYSQGTGGYGDGVGTPANTNSGMSVYIDHSLFRYNTQDGFDGGHMDAGSNTLSITNSTFYGNSGGEFKWGGNFTTAVITNNLVVSNCLRLAHPIPGAPATFNANLGDFCRAQDAISFNFRQGGTLQMTNNSIVTYSPTTFDIACWDASCTQSTFNYSNNVVLAYDNSATYNMGGQIGGPGGFYYQSLIGHITRNNNIYSGLRNINCPTGNAAEFCTSPLFVGQPTWVDDTSLDNFNFNLTAGSPAKGAGATLPAGAVDYNGLLRGNPPTIGGLE